MYWRNSQVTRVEIDMSTPVVRVRTRAHLVPLVKYSYPTHIHDLYKYPFGFLLPLSHTYIGILPNRNTHIVTFVIARWWKFYGVYLMGIAWRSQLLRESGLSGEIFMIFPNYFFRSEILYK